MPSNQTTSPLPPRSASFPFSWGSFDFPHASTSPPPASGSSGAARARTDQLAQFINRRQHERAQRAALDREEGVPQPPPRMDASRRRQPAQAVPPHVEREPGSFVPQRAANATASRLRATPSERHLRPTHTREQPSAEVDSATNMLDEGMLPNSTLSTASRDHGPAGSLDGLRRRPKRRKLNHDARTASSHDGFRYGYKGQVVPGRLKMQIVSCDGGEYEKYNSERLYKVQNVLANDKSVYCSQSSSCNLLLKHIGEAPFCLDKVVIRAPDRGFTAPVQEGLIFVSMSPENLLAGTAAYKLEYSSPSPAPSPTPSAHDDQLLSLQEAVGDSQIREQSHQIMEERIERLRLRSRRLRAESFTLLDQVHQRAQRRNADDEDLIEDSPYLSEDHATPFGGSASTSPPFTITMESGQEESDENEALPSAAVMADRFQRENHWRRESRPESEGEDALGRFPPLRLVYASDSLETHGERRWRSQRYVDPIRAARLHAPSRIEPVDSQFESEGLIAPHARFFIARHKNKITIKFAPAISGKCILLKLWSPTHDGNIDIENVQFYGYSGPRFFPAIQPC